MENFYKIIPRWKTLPILPPTALVISRGKYIILYYFVSRSPRVSIIILYYVMRGKYTHRLYNVQ